MTINVDSFFHEQTNTISHVVRDSASLECAIIDPVLDFDPASGRTSTAAAETLLARVQKLGLKISYICETHVHADHLSAAVFIKQHSGAPIVIGSGVTQVAELFAPVFASAADSSRQLCPDFFDRLLEDNEALALGATQIRVMATPGHTPACVTYVVGDAAFVGDTLFMPDFGSARTDFPGGDAATLYHSIGRILRLPERTRLFMCHDYKAPGRDTFAWETTVAEQRQSNIHINSDVSEADFVKFRTNRDARLSMPALLLPSVQVNLRGGQLPEAEDNGVRYLKLPLDYF